MSRALFGIIFLGITVNVYAFSWFGESKPGIPDEGLQAEGNHEWQRAISIYLDTLLSNPNRVDLWLRVANLEHQIKNYSLAIDAYKHAIALQPNDAKLYKTLSEIYAELNRPNKRRYYSTIGSNWKPAKSVASVSRCNKYISLYSKIIAQQ